MRRPEKDTYTDWDIHIGAMKTKLTIAIDRDLLSKARRCARSHGVSLSDLIVAGMRQLQSGGEAPTFSSRWRGKFVPAGASDERYDALAKKYLH